MVSSFAGILDDISNEYFDLNIGNVVEKKFLSYISEYIVNEMPIVSSVIEMGVGHRTWTSKLLDKFNLVTTVDASKILLDALEKEIPKYLKSKWHYEVSLFEDYMPSQPVDLVVGTYVMEHVDDPLLVMKRVKKWLKKDGFFVVTVPHALSLHRRLAVKMGIQLQPGDLGETDLKLGHKHCFSIETLEKLFFEANFKIIKKEGLGTKLLPNSNLSSCSDSQLKGMFELGFELPMEFSSALFYIVQSR